MMPALLKLKIDLPSPDFPWKREGLNCGLEFLVEGTFPWRWMTVWDHRIFSLEMFKKPVSWKVYPT